VWKRLDGNTSANVEERVFRVRGSSRKIMRREAMHTEQPVAAPDATATVLTLAVHQLPCGQRVVIVREGGVAVAAWTADAPS
jgi:hypothetical protein